MRVDPAKDGKFLHSKQWDGVDLELDAFRPRDPKKPHGAAFARSFSGHERNRMFIQTDNNFEDVTLFSGADSRNDCRGFALFDFDHDGWLDLGVTSPQSPRFQVFRNTIGDGEANPNHSTFVSLEGGNHQAESQNQWSARDPYGASLVVTIGDTKRAYQLSCGEGLATQNSKWIHVGLGQSEKIDRIDVNWPSGKKTVHENIPANSRITLLENGTSK